MCTYLTRGLKDVSDIKWDSFSCQLSSEERKDTLFVHNIVHGHLPTGLVFPILIDLESGSPSASEGQTTPYVRSVNFLRRLSEDWSPYMTLFPDAQRSVMVSIRDLYLAAIGVPFRHNSYVSQDEITVLRKLLDNAVGHEHIEEAQDITISFHPSRQYSLVRFVNWVVPCETESSHGVYARVVSNPNFYVVFVNPAELSYHNFENIIPIDRWFERALPVAHQAPVLNFHYSQMTEPRMSKTMSRPCMRFSLGGDTRFLEKLGSLDFFVAPVNIDQRGGKRFIFQSAILADALTRMFDDQLLAPLQRYVQETGRPDIFKFVHVNPVFRVNQFLPGDRKFEVHRDISYFDKNRRHISLFTLLLYITGGKGKPVLEVSDQSIRRVNPMDCIVFDQMLPHSGNPFVSGPKVFIRTELIFQWEGVLDRLPEAALEFSRGCYLSTYQAPVPTMLEQASIKLTNKLGICLAEEATRAFERANALHYNLDEGPLQEPVILHKTLRLDEEPFSFATNGYDYWFKVSHDPEFIVLKWCVCVAILDYFNIKCGDKSFRLRCRTTMTRSQDVWGLLPSERFTVPVLENLEEEMSRSVDGYYNCCEKEGHINEYRNKHLPEAFQNLYGEPVTFLGEKVYIEPDNFTVLGDKVFVISSSGGTHAPINFAACQTSHYVDDFLVIKGTAQAPKLAIPPVVFHEYPEGYHLVMDFFRNDWMVDLRESIHVPIPVLDDSSDGCSDRYIS